jgi:zinc-binding alcohol dehydrogenase/oxidoreductase
MLAFTQAEKGQSPSLQNAPSPTPAEGELLIQIKAAALNHRDVFISKGQYASIRYPVIFGSDGAGLVDGREVILNPGLFWGENPGFSGADFQILGMPRAGTFAEYTTLPAQYVHDKPAHLSWAEAAALPLAGVTAYRALFTRARLRAGERVFITGIGGGVALFALQFAQAAGAEVWVNSGSDEKIAKAIALGAKGGVNYRQTEWFKDPVLSPGFDVIIDGTGGEGLGHLLRLAKPGARIVSYGGTLGMVPNFSPQVLFWKQLQVLGSTMGNEQDFVEMLDFVVQHQIRPVIDSVFPLKDAGQAFQRMEAGEQFGKICLEV